MARRCAATRSDGGACGNWSLPNSEFCRHHGEGRAFTGRRWVQDAVCLEEEGGTSFLSAHYSTSDKGGAEKVLALLGSTPALDDRRLTTVILCSLVGGGVPRAVYCRTHELQQRLRDWLAGLLVTLADGREVLGSVLAGRVRTGPPSWDSAVPPLILPDAGADGDAPPGREGPLSYRLLPFDSSRITMQAVQALSRGKEMAAYGEQRQHYAGQHVRWSPAYWKALPFDTMPTKVRGDWLRGMIGFSEDPGEAVWATLVERGALAVQAHFVLWARALQQQGAESDGWITLTSNDLCDDLGFARLPGERGHHPERRREAYRVFKLLTKIELHALYFNKQQKPARWLHGGIWVAGLTEQRQVADPEEPELWVPAWLRYQPGDWFRDKQWREWNQHIGVISRGFLGLDAGDRDKWAVLVGGYLGAHAPVNGYAELTAKVETLCEATGMAATYLPNRKAAEMLRKLERALERLEAVGVIAGWEFLKDRSRIRVQWPAALKAEQEGICDRLERVTRRRQRSKL
jgi:hypothetical protein